MQGKNKKLCSENPRKWIVRLSSLFTSVWILKTLPRLPQLHQLSKLGTFLQRSTLNCVQSLSNQMMACGEILKDQDLVVKVLRTLSSRFDYVVVRVEGDTKMAQAVVKGRLNQKAINRKEQERMALKIQVLMKPIMMIVGHK